MLAPACSALGLPDANHSRAVWLAATVHPVSVKPAHSEIQAAHLRPLIDQVLFNQKAVSFDPAVTVGPGAGDLEIQFTPPASTTPDHLRYRLAGFDTEWQDAGPDRDAVYHHLVPGRYSFDFEVPESGATKGIPLQSIPVTITAPYWQTETFRSGCMMFLVILVLALHRFRVRYLIRQNKQLEQTVSLTKAELTLAAQIAGDAQEALKEQALKDGLTGLWNRRAIFAMLEREVCRAQRDRFPITLVMLDLDHFKVINDTHGHLTGDEVLREAAGRLMEVMRPYDFAGRYGGEEFLVVLPSCASYNAVQRAEDFRRAIAERPVPTALGPVAITCSLGVAAYDYIMPVEDLIHRADEALYRAKRQGRNCVCAGI